jgi:hypothetical protein
MILLELTDRASAATVLRMQGCGKGMRRSGRRGLIASAMLVAGAITLPGCVSVTAPDKPIVIELNINIKQEVIYRLAQDAGKTIEKNSEIF